MLAYRRIGNFRLTAPQKSLQLGVNRRASGGFVILPQTGHHALKQHSRPAHVIEHIGRKFIAWFGAIAIFRLLRREWNKGLVATPLLPVGAPPFLRQKPLQGSQEKRAKAAALAFRARKIAAFQKALEKRLRQILCVLT